MIFHDEMETSNYELEKTWEELRRAVRGPSTRRGEANLYFVPLIPHISLREAFLLNMQGEGYPFRVSVILKLSSPGYSTVTVII
jgi:hypothetical protein